MKLTVSIPDSRPYPICITHDAPGVGAAALLAEVLSPKARRVLIVTDDNVAPLYAEAFAAGVDPFASATIVLPHGEATKSLDTVAAVLDAAFTHKLSRTDAFIALGGGVIGDITGFAASIYQRGVDVVQVPTTLLAQVDSSVGGKTGVNHASGKNLIGSFWQPRAVIASQAVLRTLPAREVRCGLAEAVKHAFIAEPTLLDQDPKALLALDRDATAALVAACCRIKAEVVASDPREDPIAGRRAILNFGHTFGHAYEKLLGYGQWTHGEAVAVGMVWAARLSDRLSIATTRASSMEYRVRSVLEGLGLPADPEAPGLPDLDALIEAAKGDKKGDSSGVRFVLLADFGQPVIQHLLWPDVRAVLAPGPRPA